MYLIFFDAQLPYLMVIKGLIGKCANKKGPGSAGPLLL